MFVDWVTATNWLPGSQWAETCFRVTASGLAVAVLGWYLVWSQCQAERQQSAAHGSGAPIPWGGTVANNSIFRSKQWGFCNSLRSFSALDLIDSFPWSMCGRNGLPAVLRVTLITAGRAGRAQPASSMRRAGVGRRAGRRAGRVVPHADPVRPPAARLSTIRLLPPRHPGVTPVSPLVRPRCRWFTIAGAAHIAHQESTNHRGRAFRAEIQRR